MTNFSIALCNFLQNKCRHNVAFIELNATNQIRLLNLNTNNYTFRKNYINFFPNSTLNNLQDILKQDYDFFILDFGVLNQYTINEYARCHMQLAICPLSSWKKTVLEEFLETLCDKYINYQTHITFLGYERIKENLTRIHRTYKIDILPLPFLPNPFQITSEDFDFFNNLLERM